MCECIRNEEGGAAQVLQRPTLFSAFLKDAENAARFGVKNTFDPAQNIEGGIRYLKFLMEFFDQKLDLVLAGYNAGENAVKRHGGIPPYSETKGYVHKVQALYSSYRQWAAKAAQPSLRIKRIVQSNGQVLLTNTPLR